MSFYLSPTIACLVCHRLNTSPVHIPMVSPLASHLPGLPWEVTVSFYLSSTIACHLPDMPWEEIVSLPLPYHSLPWEDTVSFYLSPTIACLVCHRLNTSPVHIPKVSPLASHLPGLPWEVTVSFYLSPTIACHLPGMPWEEIVSFYLSPTIACLVCHRLNTSPVYIPVVSPLASHLPGLPWRRLCPSTSPLPWPAMGGHCVLLPLPYHSLPSLSPT